MPDFEVEYRTVSAEEISPELFEGFVRTQKVVKCLRKRDGKLVVEDDPFIDDWDEEDIAKLCEERRRAVSGGGVMFGAFVRGRLKGFAAVEPEFSGSRSQYLILSELHVSVEQRGCGTGTELFVRAKQWALNRGAEKLYISAHSAVESQSFYASVGCVEAEEYNADLVEKEPFDCQLECVL